MAKKPALASKSTSKSLVPHSLFGLPPVLKSEDLAAYDALLAHVSKCVKPKDILEKIWIRDAVDLTWEVLRWRRLTTNLLESRSLADCIDDVERVDRLAMAAEARRNAALREIERHRSSFAQNLRRTIHDVEDAEFKLVASTNYASNNTGQKNAA